MIHMRNSIMDIKNKMRITLNNWKYLIENPLIMLIVMLTWVLFIAAAKSFIVLNPFQNVVASFTVIWALQRIYLFFLFNNYKMNYIVYYRIEKRIDLLWYTKWKNCKRYFNVLKWKIDLLLIQKRCLKFIGSTGIFVGLLIVISMLSLNILLSAISLGYTDIYNQYSLDTIKICEKETMDYIEQYILKKIDREKVWDGMSLRNFMKIRISGELGEAMNLVAAQKAAEYFEFSSDFSPVVAADKLTNIDVYQDSNYVNQTEEGKERLNAFLENINTEFYPEYQLLYEKYKELINQYKKLKKTLEQDERQVRKIFYADSLIELYNKADRIKEAIIPERDMERLEECYNSGRKKIFISALDSCILNLESKQEWDTAELQLRKLRKGRLLILYDCEKTYLELREGLEDFQFFIRNFLKACYGDADRIFNTVEMLRLIDYGYISDSYLIKKDINIALLKTMVKQIRKTIDYQDYTRREMDLEAFTQCIALYQLQYDVDQYRQKIRTHNISLEEHSKILNELCGLLDRAEGGLYQTDIELIDRYLVKGDLYDKTFFLVILPGMDWELMRNFWQDFLWLREQYWYLWIFLMCIYLMFFYIRSLYRR